MKQTYAKPFIVIEHYNVSQTVATGGCGAVAGGSSLGKPAHWDKHSCGWDIGGWSIWTREGICDEVQDIDYDLLPVCYNNPDGAHNIFSS